MVDYADIGKRIRACRLAKGMTQEQLANEVGVVVTHIQPYRNRQLRAQPENAHRHHQRTGLLRG